MTPMTDQDLLNVLIEAQESLEEASWELEQMNVGSCKTKLQHGSLKAKMGINKWWETHAESTRDSGGKM